MLGSLPVIRFDDTQIGFDVQSFENFARQIEIIARSEAFRIVFVDGFFEARRTSQRGIFANVDVEFQVSELRFDGFERLRVPLFIAVARNVRRATRK